jgi:hypothetical protein
MFAMIVVPLPSLNHLRKALLSDKLLKARFNGIDFVATSSDGTNKNRSFLE